MPTDRNIVIFVKAPVPGFVKTRLTPTLTPKQAAELSKAMACDTLKVAQAVPKVDVSIAYQPHPDLMEPTWLTQELLPPLGGKARARMTLLLKRAGPCKRWVGVGMGGPVVRPYPPPQSSPPRGEEVFTWFLQEGNDLGERLERAIVKMFESGPRGVLVIGSDLPGLTSSLLEKAFGSLRTADVVLGPSEDGGYYLVGMRKPHTGLFQSIPWSGAAVLTRTIANLQTLQLSYKLLPQRCDVDTAEDLRRLRSDPSFAALEFQRTRAIVKGL